MQSFRLLLLWIWLGLLCKAQVRVGSCCAPRGVSSVLRAFQKFETRRWSAVVREESQDQETRRAIHAHSSSAVAFLQQLADVFYKKLKNVSCEYDRICTNRLKRVYVDWLLAAGCWLLAAACCVLRAVYYQVCAVCCVLCDVCTGTFVQILAYFCHPQRAPMAPIINTVAVAKTSDS